MSEYQMDVSTSLTDLIADYKSRMTQEEYLELVEDLFADVQQTIKKKNHDYTGDSGDPFANFRMSKAEDVAPPVGLMIRVQDKFQRIRTFINRGELAVDGEGWRDAVKDVIGYMPLLYGLLTEAERRQELLLDQKQIEQNIDVDTNHLTDALSWAEGVVSEIEPGDFNGHNWKTLDEIMTDYQSSPAKWRPCLDNEVGWTIDEGDETGTNFSGPGEYGTAARFHALGHDDVVRRVIRTYDSVDDFCRYYAVTGSTPDGVERIGVEDAMIWWDHTKVDKPEPEEETYQDKPFEYAPVYGERGEPIPGNPWMEKRPVDGTQPSMGPNTRRQIEAFQGLTYEGVVVDLVRFYNGMMWTYRQARSGETAEPHYYKAWRHQPDV